MVSGHLHEKNGRFYVILNFVDDRGHRKPKWFSTGLPVKGNKRKAEAMLHELRQQYDSALLPVCNAPPRIDDTMQFADYMLYWLNIIRTEVEVDTYASYQSIIKQRIVPYFRQRQITLAQLRPVDIQDFYTYCCLMPLKAGLLSRTPARPPGPGIRQNSRPARGTKSSCGPAPCGKNPGCSLVR